VLAPRWDTRALALLLIALAALAPFLPSAGPVHAQAVTSFPLPTAGSAPSGIAAGRDGALGFTEFYNRRIGRITTFPLL
jgi:hypothetical protein